MNEGLQLHEARYTRNNSGHNNATDSRQCQEHETLRIKPTGISKRLHPSNELPQDLTLIMEVTRDIQYKSRRVGNKGNLALQDLARNIGRAVDLATREYLETFWPIIEMQIVDRQLVGLEADFEEFMQHLLGIVQRIHEFTKVLEDRNWISAVLCCDNEDLRVIQKYHKQLREWRRDFNNEVERLLILADHTTKRDRESTVAGPLNDVQSSSVSRNLTALLACSNFYNSTINIVGGNQTDNMTLCKDL